MLLAGQPISALLAAQPDPDGFVFAGFVFLLGLAGAAWGVVERDRRRKMETSVQQMRAQFLQLQAAQDTPDPGLVSQQRQIGELTIAKLKAEVALMEAQLKAGVPLDDRLEAGREAHELMVEKTKLEIDGLRLHNTEVRRRLEDWRTE